VHRHPERSLARARLFTAAAAALLAAALLSACTGPEPVPSGSSVTSPAAQPSPTATPAPTTAAPTLVPDGTAADNLPLFTSVVASVWVGPEPVAGRAYIDALVDAGFDKAAMELTPDVTTVGNAAESIQFSVRWGEECLIGQVGPATGEPVTAVADVLAEGTCLVGRTRPITW
jgi:hypothetical protein